VIDVQLQANPADMASLRRQIERAQSSLGKDMAEALTWAAWSVAKTLGTASKIAPKQREYKLVDGGKLDKADGKKSFVVKVWRQKASPRWVFTRAASVAELKAQSLMQIKRRGLAQKAWMWCIKKVRRSASVAVAGPIAGILAKTATVDKKLTGRDQYVSMTNGLDYASEAFKQDGDRTAANAVERAAGMMEHTIDDKLKKAVK